MNLRYILRIFRLLVFAVLFTLVLAPEWPQFGDEAVQLRALVQSSEFDFLTWETNAFLVKGEAILSNNAQLLTPALRKQVVLDFLELVQETGQLRAEIDSIYVDPAVQNPDQASQDLQKTLALKRALLSQLQPVAEAVVQEQVGTILAEQGFGAAARRPTDNHQPETSHRIPKTGKQTRRPLDQVSQIGVKPPLSERSPVWLPGRRDLRGRNHPSR